jgi:hypothetical protein
MISNAVDTAACDNRYLRYDLLAACPLFALARRVMNMAGRLAAVQAAS